MLPTRATGLLPVLHGVGCSALRFQCITTCQERNLVRLKRASGAGSARGITLPATKDGAPPARRGVAAALQRGSLTLRFAKFKREALHFSLCGGHLRGSGQGSLTLCLAKRLAEALHFAL